MDEDAGGAVGRGSGCAFSAGTPEHRPPEGRQSHWAPPTGRTSVQLRSDKDPGTRDGICRSHVCSIDIGNAERGTGNTLNDKESLTTKNRLLRRNHRKTNSPMETLAQDGSQEPQRGLPRGSRCAKRPESRREVPAHTAPGGRAVTAAADKMPGPSWARGRGESTRGESVASVEMGWRFLRN